MVFNTTLNNNSVISWQSVLLVEEIGEYHRPVSSHWHTWSHNAVSTMPHMIGTDCIGICKSNYHVITTTLAPLFIGNPIQNSHRTENSKLFTFFEFFNSKTAAFYDFDIGFWNCSDSVVSWNCSDSVVFWNCSDSVAFF